MISTKKGTLIAKGYLRVVHGKRGDYIEFEEKQLCKEVLLKIASNTHETNGFYDEYRTFLDNVKVYHQFGYVGYADYIPGMWYVSPEDLSETFPLAPKKLDEFFHPV